MQTLFSANLQTNYVQSFKIKKTMPCQCKLCYTYAMISKMLKPSGFYIVMALFVMAMLCGCAKESVQPAEAKSIEGFTAAGQRVYGGASLADANLKRLSATMEDGDVRITLQFTSGSRLSGSETEKAADKLPTYNLCIQEAPTRLVIEFENLAYWDYLRALDLSAAPLIQGSFQHTLTEGDTVSLYIHFSEDMVFRVEEEGDTVSVLLRAVEKETEKTDYLDVTGAGLNYYVVADAYRDYCSGKLTRELDMLPCLCVGGERVVLISAGFQTRKAAEQFMESTLAGAKNAVAANWSIYQLEHNALPDFSEEVLRLAAYGTESVRIEGIPNKLAVLIPDGHYLCDLPGGSGVLYSKRITESQLLEDYVYEQLYILDAEGNSKRLLSFEFETIEKAAYSPDGRKLAVLEKAAESSHLYIFETDTRELLTDLSELGFGDMISTFIWDSLGMKIYAIGGSSGMQLHEYAFDVPNEAKRHSVVDKDGMEEGSLGYSNGELYFVEEDINASFLYRIKPEGGVRKEFIEGSSFAISPNERYMAINASTLDQAAEKRESSFFLCNMETGKEDVITKAFSVYSYFWSSDGERIYYFENLLSGSGNEGEETGGGGGSNDAFPYVLWVYELASKESQRVLELSATTLYAAGEPGKLYMCYMDSETLGERVRATYIVDVDEILAAR